MIKTFRLVSLVEATSYLVLVAGTIYKYSSGNESVVKAVGPIHGVLFLAYAALCIINAADLKWDWKRVLSAVILGSLPFGGYFVERKWIVEPNPAD